MTDVDANQGWRDGVAVDGFVPPGKGPLAAQATDRTRRPLGAFLAIAVISVLAAVLNLLVAWAAVCLNAREVFHLERSRDVAATNWPAPVPSGWPAPTSQYRRSSCAAGVTLIVTETRVQGYIAGFPMADPRDTSVQRTKIELPTHSLTQLEAGWPFRSFTATTRDSSFVRSRPTEQFSYESGVLVPSAVLGTPQLPLAPIWPGLLVNTVVYAGAIIAVLRATTLARRRLRRSRGLCAWCRYNLRSSVGGVCPECGRAAPMPAAVRSA